MERAAVGEANPWMIGAANVDGFEGLEAARPDNCAVGPDLSACLAEVGDGGVRRPDGFGDLRDIYQLSTVSKGCCPNSLGMVST